MALKLIKVAKELNVGLHTIVETLQAKGFNGVEEKPTAEITDDMLAVLQKEFQKDLAIKQEADKLARPVLRKESVATPTTPTTPQPPSQAQRPNLLSPRKETPPPAPTPVQAPLPSSAPAPTPVPEPEISVEQPVAKPEEPQTPILRERPQGGLKVVGRIDLNTPKPAPKPHQGKPEKQDPPALNKEVEAKQDSSNPPAKTPVVTPQTPPVKPTPPPPPPPGPAEESSEGDTYRADAPQLRGLKILGKINLDAPKKEEPSGGNRQGGGNQGQRGNDNRGGGQRQGGSNQGQGGQRSNDNRGGGQRQGGGYQGQGGQRSGDNRGPGGNRTGGQGQGGAQGQGGNRPGGQGQGGTQGQGGNRLGGQGQQGGTQGQGGQPQGQGGAQGQGNNNDANRRKRARKRVNQPVTAENLQTTISNNQGDNKGRGRTNEPKEVSTKDIENQIRQTMARLGAGASRKRQKMRRDKRDVMRERAELAELQRGNNEKILQVAEFISVSDLASLINVKPADIIKACMTLGIFVSINQRLDAEIIEVVSSEFGYEVKFISAEEQVEVEEDEADDPNDVRPRQPIVTVMGHVDHGKTSLLDHIRDANVASGEAGGITQHIGAYEVVVEGNKKITFLDTPGHEAFTAMRARGAKVTDIAIIVIAADDNIMPQSREAISHAQAAGVPIVFAINKIDKPGADPERIKNELAQMNFLVEEWGGKYQSQDISAKKGTNIDKLLEKVLFEADLLDLKASPNRRAVGTVLEASLDKGRGYVTKMLVENGTIRDGDPIIAGEFSGKVKAMFNERGKKIKEAGPAVPVLVLGLAGAPQAGEKIKVAASESQAKEIASKRSQIIREQANRANKRISLEEIGRRLALGNFKELKLIVKGDFDGSVEALSDSLIKLSMEKIQVSVIHKAVGQIVDSDIMLASASDAIVIGFQVRPSLTARKLAEREGVEIKTYSIIYEAIEEVKAAMEGMLEPTKEEEIMGQVEIREVYKISKVGTVAGCIVQEGKVSRNHNVRVIRDGIVVYPANANQNAELASLKRFKEDVKEVRAGLECGLTIKNFNDIKAGDVVEAYVINEVKTKL